MTPPLTLERALEKDSLTEKEVFEALTGQAADQMRNLESFDVPVSLDTMPKQYALVQRMMREYSGIPEVYANYSRTFQRLKEALQTRDIYNFRMGIRTLLDKITWG